MQLSSENVVLRCGTLSVPATSGGPTTAAAAWECPRSTPSGHVARSIATSPAMRSTPAGGQPPCVHAASASGPRPICTLPAASHSCGRRRPASCRRPAARRMERARAFVSDAPSSTSTSLSAASATHTASQRWSQRDHWQRSIARPQAVTGPWPTLGLHPGRRHHDVTSDGFCQPCGRSPLGRAPVQASGALAGERATPTHCSSPAHHPLRRAR